MFQNVVIGTMRLDQENGKCRKSHSKGSHKAAFLCGIGV